MGGGASIRSQPANFARESNPSSRLVKILLKDYIQCKRAIYKRQERGHTLEPHSLKPISRKETTVQPTKATERSSEKGDAHTQAKPTRSPRKPQYSQRRRPRGRKEREDTHTQAKNSEHSTANKGDRGRHTRTTLRKTEMKSVTNDLTDTAIGSPLALEKNAPVPRPKTFKKQR